MNAFSAFAAQEVWHITGWTMLHYLWLGTLVGAFAAVCRVLLRSARPNARYATALCCLFLLAVLPFGVAAWLTSHPAHFLEGAGGGFRDPIATIELNSPSTPAHDDVIDLRSQHEALVAESESQVDAVPTNAPQLETSPKIATLEAFVPYLPSLWIIGTPITFALLAAGIVGTKRLQRTSRPLADGPVIELLSRLASSLHVARHLSVAVCDRIASPVLVGIVRPMILLPPAALTGWSPDEIEMVLLHELAHVRRWDNLINLIQRLIESLLFFHPAVWLVSTWVRREREQCCDAFVVRRTECPHAYAELLLNLAAVHPPLAGLAFARHPLRTRIRRILQLDDDPMLISGKSLALMLCNLFIAATLTVLYVPTIGQAEESTTEATQDTEGKADAEKQKNKKSSPDESSTDSEAGPKQEIAKEPQVVATIPYGGADHNEYARAFIAAYRAAREKKQYVDLVRRGNDEALVVIPEPNESNWPDVLGELPRKDRVIAEKAYARLGLKLAPITRAEATYLQLKGGPVVGAAIVGGNVPKGLPLPSYLTQLDGAEIHSMDALLRWLENDGRANLPARCNAIADDKEYMFEAYRQPTSTPVAKKPQPAPAGETESPLQPASTDRVVVAYEIPDELNDDVRQYIRNADLRGLWNERGRLIFQATPQQHEQFRSLLDATPKWRDAVKKHHRRNPPLPNFIISKVDGEDVLEWPTAGLTLKRGTQLANPGVLVDEVAPGSPAAWRGIRSGDILMTLEKFAAASLAELESILKTLMSSFPDPGKQVAAEFMHTRNNGAIYHLPTTLPLRLNNDGTPPPVLSTGELEQRRQQALPKSVFLEQQRVLEATGLKSAQPPNPSTKQQKSNLRYDGKSFFQWRDTWQTELSIEKRLEAVKALAAFGAQGYGQEAAESILDVVAEYDARQLTSETPEGRLKQAVRDGLVTKIPASIWRPLLRKRFDAAPEKWQWLAIATLQQIEPANENDRKETQSFLLLLADSQESHIASTAVSALVKLDPALENEQTKRLVMERLNGDKLNVDWRIVSDLSRTPQHPPELTDLLLHGDPQRQQLIRHALKRGSHGVADLALVNSLTTMLKDEAKAADHLAAIRALAALAPVANGAESKPVEVLQAIVKDGGAANQIAAAFAVGEITQGQIGAGPLLIGKLRNSDDKVVADAYVIEQVLESERAAVFGEIARR